MTTKTNTQTKEIKQYWIIYDTKDKCAYVDDDSIVPHFEFVAQANAYIEKRIKDYNHTRYKPRVRK